MDECHSPSSLFLHEKRLKDAKVSLVQSELEEACPWIAKEKAFSRTNVFFFKTLMKTSTAVSSPSNLGQ
jgi:hypothetical protein